MTWFDLGVLAAGMWAIATGWQAGALRVTLSLVLAAVGLVVAVLFLPDLALRTSPSDVQLRYWLLHLGFIGLPLAGYTAGGFITRRNEDVELQISELSRAAGALVVLVVFGVIVWVLAPLSERNTLLNSWSARSRTAEILRSIGDPPIDIERLIAQDSFPIGLSRFLGPLQIGEPPTELPAMDPAAQTNAEQASVQITHTSCGGYSLGSGFGIGDDLVVTNAHVVAGSREGVQVDAVTGSSRGTVVAFDQARDLALVRVPDLLSASIAISPSAAEPGDIVVTLGHPEGVEALDVSPARVVERKFLPVVVGGRETSEPLTYVLATDAVAPGSSGGAVINQAGAAIAVVFAGPDDDADYALAVSTEELDPVLETVSSGPAQTADCP